jgi:hypothetical protein
MHESSNSTDTIAIAASAKLAFLPLFSAILPAEVHAEVLRFEAPRNAGKPKLTHYQFTQALVYHQMTNTGTLSDSVLALHNIAISDAALSGRKATLGWEVFQELLHRSLTPICHPQLHPSGFYKGLRLLAVDGSSFNLQNTPAMLEAFQKAKSPVNDGSNVAFARLGCSTLVELGSRQPLGIALGMEGQGELSLLPQLLDRIPDNSLSLGDRLYGTIYTAYSMRRKSETQGRHILLRVRQNIQVTLVENLADGSRLVDVEVTHPDTGEALGTMRMREIYADVDVNGSGKTSIRLWTSLLDPVQYPALELVELYAQRWGHEVFYKEFKEELHGNDRLLLAQTPVAAAQEILAMTLAAALLARQRMAVADQAGVPVTRISFAKVLDRTNDMCLLLEVGRDILTPLQMDQMLERLMNLLIKTAVIPKRKPRKCQRAKRQIVSSWTKMISPTSEALIVSYSITTPNP